MGRRLTRLRTASGKSRREVAEARLGISEPTLHRIETGKVPVTVANVRALCWLYGADASITDALAELALGTSQQEWWDANPDIPDWFKLYVGLEASASRISSYDGEIVPGELQTEQYARAVFAAEGPPDPEAADRHVKLRMQRQQALFGRRPAPRVVTVLGEGVLTRPVGGEAVLTAQIEHLRAAARRDNVQVKVLPWSVGAHAAMDAGAADADKDAEVPRSPSWICEGRQSVPWANSFPVLQMAHVCYACSRRILCWPRALGGS